MEILQKYLGDSNKDSSLFLNQGLLKAYHYSTWALRIAASSFLVLSTLKLATHIEVHRCYVAISLHALANVVTTLVVFLNNQHLYSSTQACRLWLRNFLFLPLQLEFNQTAHLNKRGHAWYDNNYFNLCLTKISTDVDHMLMEITLKESYARVCVSVFTYIPSACLYSHWLFQDGIFGEGLHLLDGLRILFLAASVINLAVNVTAYQKYCHTFMGMLHKLDEHLKQRPRWRATQFTKFCFWRILLMQICTTSQWIYTFSFFSAISPIYAAIYVLSSFAITFAQLEHVPELEQPFQNHPYGFHSKSSYWTTRMMNTVSSVGMQPYQHLFVELAIIGGFSLSRSLMIFAYQLQFWILSLLPLDKYFRSGLSFTWYDIALIGIFWYLLGFVGRCWVYPYEFGSYFAMIGILDRVEHYPMVHVYAFYNSIYKHAFDGVSDLVSIRTLMVASMALFDPRFEFRRYCALLLKDRELNSQMLRDEQFEGIMRQGLNFELNDVNELVRAIGELRSRRLEQKFPLVLAFDDFLSMILNGFDEDAKVRDLKLFHSFYTHFNLHVAALNRYKMLKIAEIMGLKICSEDGTLDL